MINRVGELSLKESAWTADFNPWFHWNNDAADLGKIFRIVNGLVRQQDGVKKIRSGEERYAEYHIVARMGKDVDATRFPFGESGFVMHVAVSLIVLHIKPSHVNCRFGLPVGGFFAAVGNNIFVVTLVPHAERPTPAHMVNATGLLTIFFILVQPVILLYIFDTLGRERLSHSCDRLSFIVSLTGYAIVNLALSISARLL